MSINSSVSGSTPTVTSPVPSSSTGGTITAICTFVGINTISAVIPNQFSLSQNFPNPFNPTTNFEFRIADFGFVNLTIYDAIGKQVETLVNEELKPGTYKADWNATNYTSGVYFYKLIAGEFTETKRMVLVK